MEKKKLNGKELIKNELTKEWEVYDKKGNLLGKNTDYAEAAKIAKSNKDEQMTF